MSDRSQFPYSDADVEIIRHPDGSLTITTEADYGDSEAGWGSASKTIHMPPEQVDLFRAFLMPVNNPNNHNK